jgi:2-oxoglutarate ferredoxin oxidoreductase subunit beta
MTTNVVNGKVLTAPRPVDGAGRGIGTCWLQSGTETDGDPMTETRTAPGTNRVGLTRADYDGAKTTLCPGCGHNAITAGIIQAAYESSLEPHRVAKLSGIGCSSKTPAYFISRSHGFNAVHGRMPRIATGVRLANRDLLLIGVSGDGDTASIGLGQFCHLVRRNVPVTYIIENNGVYGLTKGQFRPPPTSAAP